MNHSLRNFQISRLAAGLALAYAFSATALAQAPPSGPAPDASGAPPSAQGAPRAGGAGGAGGPGGPVGGMGGGSTCSSAAAVPTAGNLMAKGSTRRNTPNPNGEPPAAPAAARNKVQLHVAAIKEALKLTADQEKYWDSYSEMVAVLARDRNQANQYAAKANDKATPMPERLQARVQYVATTCNTLNRMSPQIMLLYSNLTPEQQKIADQLDLDPEAVAAP